MAAGATGPGMVGDLVGRQAGRVQHLLRRFVERSCAALVRQDDLAPCMAGVEGGAALAGELVERQVVAGAAERPAAPVAPGHRRLPGPGGDQGEGEMGRPSVRERACHYVWDWVVAV